MAQTALSLRFPVGGLSERYGYQDQPPYTSPRLENVRAADTLENRERGGSRPGLRRQFDTALGQQRLAMTCSIAPALIAAGATAGYHSATNILNTAGAYFYDWMIGLTVTVQGAAPTDAFTITGVNDTTHAVVSPTIATAGMGAVVRVLATTITSQARFTEGMVGKDIVFQDSFNWDGAAWLGCLTPHTILNVVSSTAVRVGGDITADHGINDPFEIIEGADLTGLFYPNTLLAIIPWRGLSTTRVKVLGKVTDDTYIGRRFTFNDSGRSYTIVRVLDFVGTDYSYILLSSDTAYTLESLTDTSTWTIENAGPDSVRMLHSFRANYTQGWQTVQDFLTLGYNSQGTYVDGDLPDPPWSAGDWDGIGGTVHIGGLLTSYVGHSSYQPMAQGGSGGGTLSGTHTATTTVTTTTDTFYDHMVGLPISMISPPPYYGVVTSTIVSVVSPTQCTIADSISMPSGSSVSIQRQLASVYEALSLNEDHAYTVALKLVPQNYFGNDGSFDYRQFEGAAHIYLKLDTAPDLDTGDGIEVRFQYDSDDEEYTVTLYSHIDGTRATVATATRDLEVDDCTPAWLEVECGEKEDDGTNYLYSITVSFNGLQLLSEKVIVTQASADLAGTRVGFGLTGTYAYADTFTCRYYQGTNETHPEVLAAISNGHLYVEDRSGKLKAVDTDITFASDRLLMAAEFDGNLYIADYDDDIVDSGIDGRGTAAATFDDAAAGGQDWTTLGIDPRTDVLVVSGSSLVAPNGNDGVYRIEAVIATNLVVSATLPQNGNATGLSIETPLDYFIRRGPKVYDPTVEYVAGTSDPVYLWVADDADGVAAATLRPKGTIPTGCSILVRYRGRLCFAGDPDIPHAFYMSRVDDPHDWDYSETDVDAAIGGAATFPGVIGAPITALAPVCDDYMIVAAANEMWIMRGDPGYNGTLDQLSPAVGIVDRMAWCVTPDNAMYFMGHDGLYKIPRGAQTSPIPVSHGTVPTLLRGITNERHDILMRYDPEDLGIHVFIVPREAGDSKHYWLDIRNETFWPVSLNSDHEPFALATHPLVTDDNHRIVLLGCRDGYVRRFHEDQTTDDGETITSRVIYGPFLLGNSDAMDGFLRELTATLDLESQDVTWNIYVGDGNELALVQTTAFETGLWSAGRNYDSRPNAQGVSAVIEVTSAKRWAIERVHAVFEAAGKYLKL